VSHASLEEEIEMTVVQDQPKQKVHKTYLNHWLDPVVQTCHLSYAEKYK
jgi:hypothetical protein